ncbi:MAG: hypothetical protein K6B52_00555 [Clostridiales bacterium]|nr:hypothetical protein [Clostridiales bacterium]
MQFVLFKTLENYEFNKLGWPIGFEPVENNPTIEYYILENLWDDVDLFFDDGAIDEIAERCDSIISYGEDDYFNADKCKTLLRWIEERLLKPAVPRYKEMLEILRDYCRRAIELNTGVYIDL